MPTEVEDHTEEFDLSKLIDLSLTFRPLQITLQSVLKRLSHLEAANYEKTREIAQLNEVLAEVQRGQSFTEAGGEKVGTEGGCEHDEHDAIWDELNRLRELLGELQFDAERDRHTIEELYSARKRRESRFAMASSEVLSPVTSHSGRRVSGRAPMGDIILEKAHESLDFDLTTAYTANDVSDLVEGSQAVLGEEGDGDGERMEPPRSSASGYPSRGPSVSVADGKGHHEQLDHTSKPPNSDDRKGRRESNSTPHRALSGKIGSASTSNMLPYRPHGAPRTSVASSGIHRPGSSVFDKLRRDGEDIEHLNRVVAEILSEMKGLHDDVDVLRYANGLASTTDDPRGTEGVECDESAVRIHPSSGVLLSRLAALEKRVGDVDCNSVRRDDDLMKELDQLRHSLSPISRLKETDADNIHSIPDIIGRLRDLEAKANALDKTNSRLNDKLSSVLAVEQGGAVYEINPTQWGLLQGTVDSLEKQLAELQLRGDTDWAEQIERLRRTCAVLETDVKGAKDVLDRHQKECERLETMKADRCATGDTGSTLSPAVDDGSTHQGNLPASDLGDFMRRLLHLAGRMENAETRLNGIDMNKADHSDLQQIREELQNLKRLLELQANRDKECNRSAEMDSAHTAASDKLIGDLQKQLVAQSEANCSDIENTRDEVDSLRGLINQLDHRKADATLVANKAERDYVENALERLMREVEQVLNATNAGLIDTLDKSLNILRDMIDGKANKQDIANLQQMMAAEGAGATAADGLIGFRGYRCLGCNRGVENFRPRPLPSKMQTFLNRTPQNYVQDGVVRSIQEVQGAAALLEDRPIQYSTSNCTPQANSGGSKRAVYSEPLPPIDGSSL